MISFNLKYLKAFILLILIVMIRVFEYQIFNDGLMDFFKHDYLLKPLPKISIWHMVWIDSLRYWLNAILSIFLIKLFFHQQNLDRFLWLFYGVFYVIGVIFLLYFLNNYQPGDYLGLFYTRRFLIQPIWLFLLIPALYYQQKQTIKDE